MNETIVKKQADVSIVCANYNNGIYLKDFLKGIEEASCTPKELIIIDDGSTDQSLAILESSQLPYLVLVKHKENLGFANALNTGINRASGKYILRIDPDDVISPSRMVKQLEFLTKNTEVDIVGGNISYFWNNPENTLGTSNFPTDEITILKRYHNGEHGMLHGTVMGKASVFKTHEYKQENVPAEDYDIFSRMLLAGAKFSNLSEVITHVRIHEGSISNSLPFSTIEKTYAIRDTLFGKSTSKFFIYFNYVSLKSYRNYYFEQHRFYKLFHLAMAVLFRPDKALKRLIKS